MDVLMPQLGETVAEGKISKWFVKAGDAVKPGDNLFEIETDKTSMEVPAIAAGTLAAIHVQAGEVAPVGAVVAIIQGSGETVAASAPQAPLIPANPPTRKASAGKIRSAEASAKAEAGIQSSGLLDPRLRGGERNETPRAPIPMEPFREVRTPARNYGPARLPGGTIVTPLARRLAGEAGIDLTNVKGSGPRGRIVAADIEGAKQTRSAAPALAAHAASIVLTAEVAIGPALALCEQANAAQKTTLELSDVIAKAWGLALSRSGTPDTGITLMVGESRALVRNAAASALTAIAMMRREPVAIDGATRASSAISVPDVAGIISVADVLRAPHTTLLGIGAPRRAPAEAADGSVRFIEAITVTLSCDARTVEAAHGAALLSALKGFLERPVTMLV